MEWKEYNLLIPAKATDLVALRLYEMGSNGSIINDDNPDGLVRVTAYFPIDDNSAEEKIKAFLDSMEKDGTLGGDWHLTSASTNEEQWLYEWEKYFHPRKISSRFWVEPAWEKALPEKDEYVLTIDPGRAFGSGIHETTCLCVQLLENTVRPENYVIDVGTGTGILAIAAAKLGANHVTAVDNDRLAVDQAVINVGLNNVETHVSVECSDLLAAVAKHGVKADIIVANIVADAIISLIPDIRDYMTEKGVFIASGIIDDRIQDVREAARTNGFAIEREVSQNGWFAVQMRCHA